LSRNLLNKFGTVKSIVQACITETCHIKWIGAIKADQIKTALKVGKRITAKTSGEKKDKINPVLL
jgi:DNA repair protein RadC